MRRAPFYYNDSGELFLGGDRGKWLSVAASPVRGLDHEAEPPGAGRWLNCLARESSHSAVGIP
jgi:hypothetical protein